MVSRLEFGSLPQLQFPRRHGHLVKGDIGSHHSLLAVQAASQDRTKDISRPRIRATQPSTVVL